jgi:hypothetical protein
LDCVSIANDKEQELWALIAVLGLELRAYTLSHQPFFVKGFFQIGFWELFAQVSFEL